MSLFSFLAGLAFAASPATQSATDTSACFSRDVCALQIAYPLAPEDGNWTVELSDIRRSGFCLTQIKIILDPMIRGVSVPDEIQWEGVFHPEQLDLDRTGRKLIWNEEDVGSFVSDRQQTRSSIVEAQYKVRLVEPTVIELSVDFIIQDSPPELGMKDCVVTADYLVSLARELVE